MRVARRLFDLESHKQFASVSRDFNPVHMDPIAARRTQVGRPIIHGVHSLLWLLDSIENSGLRVPGEVELSVRFASPIFLDEDVALEFSSPMPSEVRGRICVGGHEAVVASLRPCHSGVAALARVPARRPIDLLSVPRDVRLEDIRSQHGTIDYGGTVGGVADMFPSAARTLGASRIACLACLSYLVGMVVPGQHSLFSGIHVFLAPTDGEEAQALQFEVTSVATRFRSVQMSVRAPGIAGTVDAVSRMPPVSQPSMAHVLSRFGHTEFSSSRALIIGGSRGLGEVTAKLVAAGGADVAVTYASGRTDANSVAAEINAAGLRCNPIPFDVGKPAEDQLRCLQRPPTHIYYFATPFIGQRKAALFDTQRLAELTFYYCTAFLRAIEACQRINPGGIRVFYPSSVYVESRPAGMTEYAMAKAAAEVLCSDISRGLVGVEVFMRRLPRMLTDQTNSAGPARLSDPIEVMLPIVREMHLDAT